MIDKPEDKSLDEIIPRLVEKAKGLADLGERTSEGDVFRGTVDGVFIEAKYFSARDYLDIERLGGRLVIANTDLRPMIRECNPP